MLKRLLAVMALVFLVFGSVSAHPVDSYIINGLGTSDARLPSQLLDLFINPGSLGDVLVFPYYNVRNGKAVAYIRIVNTSDRAVIGKLRLREGMESEEILDFIVCLSAHDQFTFWVTDPVLVGLSGNTAVLVKDSATGLEGDDDTVVAPSWDIAYTRTTTSQGKNIDPSRTFEGYIEFFGLNSVDEATFEKIMSGKGVDEVKACLALANMDPVVYNVSVSYQDVPNALMGEGYLFNFPSASQILETYAYKAVAFGNYHTNPLSAGLTTDFPLFKDAEAGLLGVNYVLTKTNFYVFYDLQNYLNGKSDVVINFLTKKENIDNGFLNYYSDRGSKKEEKCVSGNYTNCCVEVESKVYDDEENTPTQGVDFSPVPPGQKAKLCYEVSYMPVGSPTVATIFDTGLRELTLSTSYELGWARVRFTNSGAETTVGDSTVYGEPALVYELQSYVDGALSHMLPAAYDVSTRGEEGGCGCEDLTECSSQSECEQCGGTWLDDMKICVSCDTVCSDAFSGIDDIDKLIKCEAWQDANCR